MKVAVVGCTHAGTAAILNLKRIYPDSEVTVFERNDNISFLSCGIALYVGGVVKDPQGLFYCSPDKLRELNVDTRMRHNVESVNLKDKKIIAKNLFPDFIKIPLFYGITGLPLSPRQLLIPLL